MKKGTVHSKDENRTYITAHHGTIKKDKQISHLFPGRKKTKIIPSIKKKHHKDIKVGDKVHFDIHPRKGLISKFLYNGLPLFGIIIGFIVGISVTNEEIGILALIGLFMLLGMNIKTFIRKRFNIFREINVHIIEPLAKVEITKAKKKKKNKKKQKNKRKK